VTALSLAIEVPCRIKLIDEHALTPTYAHDGDAGADVYAIAPTLILPGETQSVDLGIAIELAPGYWAEMRPRSSQAKRSIHVSAPPIDWGYRGRISAIISNYGEDPYRISLHDRIGQMVVHVLHRARFTVVDELGSTTRNAGAFGSTGQ